MKGEDCSLVTRKCSLDEYEYVVSILSSVHYTRQQVAVKTDYGEGIWYFNTRAVGGTPQGNFSGLVGYWAVPHKNFPKLLLGNNSK